MTTIPKSKDLQNRPAWGLALVALAVLAVLLLVFQLAWPHIWRLVVLPRVDPQRHGMRVETYPNQDLGGSSSQSRFVPTALASLDTPHTSLQAFAVWQVKRAGVYQLELACDDYGSLFIDHQRVIHQQGVSARNLSQVKVELTPGPHLLVVHLHNGPAGGGFDLRVRGPGQAKPVLLGGAALQYIDSGNINFWWNHLLMPRSSQPLTLPLVVLSLLLAGLIRPRQTRIFLKSLWAPPDLEPPHSAKEVWSRLLPYLFIWGLLLAGAIVLELAFQLSKPSFLSRFSAPTLLLVGLNSLTLGLVSGLALVALLWLLAAFLPARRAIFFAARLGLRIFLAACLVALVLTHFDTWCYGAFGRDLADLSDFLYPAVILLALSATLALARRSRLDTALAGRGKALGLAMALLLMVTGAYSAQAYLRINQEVSELMSRPPGAAALPNIILFLPDSVDPKRLSAYGYNRRTSPNLDRLLSESIRYDQAYANGHQTRPSVASIMTGVHPLTSRVVAEVDVLFGRHSYLHLPGILANWGYYTLDLSDEQHGHPLRYNLRNAFYNINGHEMELEKGGWGITLRLMFARETYFLDSLAEGVLDRLGVLIGWVAYVQHRKPSVRHLVDGDIPRNSLDDTRRVDLLLEKIRTENRPLFAHVHLLGPHGPTFVFGKRHFSINPTPDQAGFENEYDDSLLTTDAHLGRVIDALKKSGKWDNTILIYLSDHNRGSGIEDPCPLVVRLPGGKAGGTVIKVPVQYLDLSPSLLSALGQTPPKWKEGKVIFPRADETALSKRPIVGFDYHGRKMQIVQGGRKLKVSLDGGPATYHGLDGKELPGHAREQAIISENLESFLHKRGLSLKGLSSP
jgi:arylsulfatase A-like enzyme